MIKRHNKTVKLSIYFAAITSVTIIFTLALFAWFTLSNIRAQAGKYTAEIENLGNIISMILVDSTINDTKKGNFDSTKAIIKLLISEDRINYVYLKNEYTNQILIGNPEQFKFDVADKNSTSKVKKFSRQISDKYTLYVAIRRDVLDVNVGADIAGLIFQCLLLFIVAGAIVSYLLSGIISQPLIKLSKAAKEIADGNFNVKIANSNFSEINDLIYSYNEMAFQLNELYSSLELKVQERTIALEEANYKLKEAQAMMVHSEKMRSLGELVAGIAHEINNPVNFIHGNIMILQNYADDLLKLIDAYDNGIDKLPDDIKAQVESIKKEIDLDFLRNDIKDLIKSCIEGTQRTKNIVLDLKNFSRMEEMVLTQFDIPKEIDTTLNILNNKYKNRITVIKNYSANVPKIEAYGGQLNQVFMNILDNAQDAMGDTGTLTINTDKVDNMVKIEFIDTGKGIPEDNLKKVFDPFFTTKPVGKGTGLGMSISYRVIKDHNGSISVESKVGKGTKFTIILPINHVNNNSENNENTLIIKEYDVLDNPQSIDGV